MDSDRTFPFTESLLALLKTLCYAFKVSNRSRVAILVSLILMYVSCTLIVADRLWLGIGLWYCCLLVIIYQFKGKFNGSLYFWFIIKIGVGFIEGYTIQGKPHSYYSWGIPMVVKFIIVLMLPIKYEKQKWLILGIVLARILITYFGYTDFLVLEIIELCVMERWGIVFKLGSWFGFWYTETNFGVSKTEIKQSLISQIVYQLIYGRLLQAMFLLLFPDFDKIKELADIRKDLSEINFDQLPRELVKLGEQIQVMFKAHQIYIEAFQLLCNFFTAILIGMLFCEVLQRLLNTLRECWKLLNKLATVRGNVRSSV